MDSSKKCLDLPSKFGYSQQTTSGEVECWFGPFCSRCNKTIVERIQKCICVDVQGYRKYPTSLSTTSNWAWYQYTCITSSKVSDEPKLCRDCEIRCGQVFSCRVHHHNGGGNFSLSHCGGVIKEWKASNLCGFPKAWRCQKKKIFNLYLLQRKY